MASARQEFSWFDKELSRLQMANWLVDSSLWKVQIVHIVVMMMMKMMVIRIEDDDEEDDNEQRQCEWQQSAEDNQIIEAKSDHSY